MTLFYDANGNNQIDTNETFNSVSGSGSQNATISTTFPQGTYFLELEYGGFNNSTAYQLTLTQTPRPGNLPSDPGNSNNPRDLGRLSGTVPTQIDLVGELDDRDFYKFTVDQIGDFNANIGGLSNSVNMTLIYDANGNGLIDTTDPSTSSSGSRSANGSISTPLAPGTYFIDLDYSDFTNFNTRYELNLSYALKPGNLNSDPSDNPNAAFDLGTISGTRTLIDLVGSFDDVDFYKFNLGAVNSFTASLVKSPAKDTTMTLYFDANGNGLIDNNETLTGGFSDLINRNNLSAGTYFISLDAFSLGPVNTRYELTLGIG
jgi:hypothetical protein